MYRYRVVPSNTPAAWCQFPSLTFLVPKTVLGPLSMAKQRPFVVLFLTIRQAASPFVTTACHAVVNDVTLIHAATVMAAVML